MGNAPIWARAATPKSDHIRDMRPRRCPNPATLGELEAVLRNHSETPAWVWWMGGFTGGVIATLMVEAMMGSRSR
jgi:hypothetical protein